MERKTFSQLPLGVSDFHKLRELEKIYVDKTGRVSRNRQQPSRTKNSEAEDKYIQSELLMRFDLKSQFIF